MKRFLILLFVLAQLISFSQAKIGMSPVFSFTPASASSPASTVNFGDTVSLKVYIKNYGNTAYNGWVNLIANRDTTGGVLCDSMSVSLNLQPNDSSASVLTFTPGPGGNAFKSGGNGNTIVVWPFIVTGTALPGDSVRPILWINDVNSVHEFEKNQFKIYPNPATQTLTIVPFEKTIYKNIIIYDVFARKIKELKFQEIVDVSELSSGSYWIIINSESKSYRIPFIKE